MKKLRQQLEQEYLKNGLSVKAIRLSQELDILIAKEQRKRLKMLKE